MSRSNGQVSAMKLIALQSQPDGETAEALLSHARDMRLPERVTGRLEAYLKQMALLSKAADEHEKEKRASREIWHELRKEAGHCEDLIDLIDEEERAATAKAQASTVTAPEPTGDPLLDTIGRVAPAASAVICQGYESGAQVRSAVEALATVTSIPGKCDLRAVVLVMATIIAEGNEELVPSPELVRVPFEVLLERRREELGAGAPASGRFEVLEVVEGARKVLPGRSLLTGVLPMASDWIDFKAGRLEEGAAAPVMSPELVEELRVAADVVAYYDNQALTPEETRHVVGALQEFGQTVAPVEAPKPEEGTGDAPGEAAAQKPKGKKGKAPKGAKEPAREEVKLMWPPVMEFAKKEGSRTVLGVSVSEVLDGGAFRTTVCAILRTDLQYGRTATDGEGFGSIKEAVLAAVEELRDALGKFKVTKGSKEHARLVELFQGLSELEEKAAKM